MTKTALDSIASAKAKLVDELRKLEEQETALRKDEASAAYTQIAELLGKFGGYFSPKQKAEIAVAVGASAPGRGSRTAQGKTEVAPKYWLPHTQETWSGRGRPPRAFTAWEGSAAYNEWKAKHPGERFPKYPG